MRTRDARPLSFTGRRRLRVGSRWYAHIPLDDRPTGIAVFEEVLKNAGKSISPLPMTVNTLFSIASRIFLTRLLNVFSLAERFLGQPSFHCPSGCTNGGGTEYPTGRSSVGQRLSQEFLCKSLGGLLQAGDSLLPWSYRNVRQTVSEIRATTGMPLRTVFA